MAPEPPRPPLLGHPRYLRRLGHRVVCSLDNHVDDAEFDKTFMLKGDTAMFTDPPRASIRWSFPGVALWIGRRAGGR